MTAVAKARSFPSLLRRRKNRPARSFVDARHFVDDRKRSIASNPDGGQ